MGETNADIAVGSKFLSKETIKIPKYRYIGNKLLNLITSVGT
ncbi:MAG: hypothetical protein N3D72_02845 [Candidatus Methanomethyliaceae archaeon]|nr:hypothetical protein [Candidatus Methanomethyliaceae archaeon]